MGVPAPKTEEDTTAHALFSTVALTVKVSVRLHLAATNLRFVSIVVTLCHLHRSCTEALDRHSLLNLICVLLVKVEPPYVQLGFLINHFLMFSTVDECEKCDIHALCANGHCRCKSGYYGNGYQCEKGK